MSRAVFVLILVLTPAAAWPVSAQGDVETRLQQASELERSGNRKGAGRAYRAIVADAGGDTVASAKALVALASLEYGDGTYTDAVSHAREASDIFARLGDAANTALALNRAGSAAVQAGDYPLAATLFEQAVAKTPATDAEGRAERLSNLGSVSLYLGRYADAARLYADALASLGANDQAEWARRRRRILWINQATLQQRLGRLDEALELYRRAGGGTDLRPRERAQSLANLGTLYRRLGDPVKALGTYDQARAYFATDRDDDGEINVLTNRGIALALDLGQWRPAGDVFSNALDLARRSGNRRRALVAQLYRGETFRRSGNTESARADFHAALQEARALHTAEEEWKALFGLARLERAAPGHGRASPLLEQAVTVIEGIREELVMPALRSDFFRDKREVYDELIASKIATAPVAEVFALMERSRARAWRERVGLSAQSDLATIQRSLRPGTTLLEYWSSALGSAVVRVTAQEAEVVRLTTDDMVLNLLREALARLATGPSDRSDADAGALGASLLPTAVMNPGPDDLIVVPDGPLSAVPFEWLRVNGRPLVETTRVSYLPTAELTVRTEAPDRHRPQGSPRPPWHPELMAFGDPVFTSEAFPLGGTTRPRLSASGDEVRQIAATLGGQASVFVGADNRKARLLDARTRVPSILHVATHAMVDPSTPERSHLVFSSLPGSPDADYLFLREAYDLPLTGVELAVLSACETDRGDNVPGEGVQSFSRAFLAAGAASTVTTLWRVPDGPTAEFMKVFYYYLQEGAERSEALRQAKLDFAQSGTPLAAPHYWAAFVLTGETGRVSLALRWRDVVAWTLLLVAALALVTTMFARRFRKSVA